MMKRNRRAKILATLGPASSTADMIDALFVAGADVFRLNFSHGDHKDHKKRYDTIRDLEKKYNRPVAILLDLQGPKLRVGQFENGSVDLVAGNRFRLDLSDKFGDLNRAQLPHPEIFKALEQGADLLLDDGRIKLRVLDCADDFAETEIINGGTLSNNKGVNVPSVILNLSSLTAKDHKDLRYGLKLGIDWVALSFVQRPEDVAEIRKIVGSKAWVMSKFEKPQALEKLEEIIELSDGVMVARGDLGVEMPPEDVPILQKLIVRTCREAGKPVVVATQMLESMITSPMPTRAEASDVATAIYDGADAVMLSAETAVGDYAIEAVTIMDRIMQRVEQDPSYRKGLDHARHAPEATAADAITAAATQVATTITAAAIVTFTATGSTTLRCARERPTAPILGLTPRLETARRLVLVWGVHSVITPDCKAFRDMVVRSIKVAKDEDIAKIGDALAITAGVPFGTPGATNILRIAWVD